MWRKFLNKIDCILYNTYIQNIQLVLPEDDPVQLQMEKICPEAEQGLEQITQPGQCVLNSRDSEGRGRRPG
jgi:hypothetical protein